MSFDVLKKKVQDKAVLLAQEQDLSKQEELSMIKNESDQRISDFDSLHQRYLSREKMSLQTSILGTAKSEVKISLNKAKQQIFESLSEEVFSSIESLSLDEKKSLYLSFFKRASQVILVERILCTSKDEKILKSLSLKKVEILVDDSLQEGLIFESLTSKQRVDMRISILLDSILQDSEDELMSLII